jgi:hypothetical protein
MTQRRLLCCLLLGLLAHGLSAAGEEAPHPLDLAERLRRGKDLSDEEAEYIRKLKRRRRLSDDEAAASFIERQWRQMSPEDRRAALERARDLSTPPPENGLLDRLVRSTLGVLILALSTALVIGGLTAWLRHRLRERRLAVGRRRGRTASEILRPASAPEEDAAQSPEEPGRQA